MWPFKKKTRQRRVEARRNVAVSALSLWRRLRDVSSIPALLLALALFVGAVVMDVWPLDPLPYRPGQYLPDDVHVRAPFQVLSTKRLGEVVARVRESTPATFRLDGKLIDEIAAALKALPKRFQPTTRPADVDKQLLESFGPFDEESLRTWRTFAEPTQQEQYEQRIDLFRKELAKLPLVAPEQLQAQRQRSAWQVFLADDSGRDTRDLADLIALNEKNLSRVAAAVGPALETFDPQVRQNVKTYLLGILAKGRCLYQYDEERTAKDIAQAVADVEADPPPETFERYNAGELLVARSRRRTADDKEEVVGLDEAGLTLLRYEHQKYLANQYDGKPWRIWWKVAARTLILLLTTMILCLYVFRYHNEIVKQFRRTLTLVALLLLMLALNKTLCFGLGWNPHVALLPVLMAAIILTIAYDTRFAMTMGSAVAFIIVLQLRAGMPMLVLLLAGITTSVFQLRDIRTRSKLIVVSAITAAACLAVVFALAVSASIPVKFALFDGLWAGGFALLAGFLVQGILPLIERIFRIATSMTLLEWCDASKPMLKRLAMKAPGTYNHSLQLGSMCEAAADAVGARGLLARVGAYYHDIGKTNKPSYFVENKEGSQSKHDKLSPEMSLLIIIGHVKDGLELAREYGLPRVLHEFIATHHGTTLVQYFYAAATEQRKNGSDRAPDELEFRYPGPKPHSKEAAILMLADASESSVRAMGDPTPGRIENQVHTMVNRRLMDGQLDECELTLKEVHRIESSLIKSLCGIYHARITYPTPAGQKPSAGEMEVKQNNKAPADTPSPPAEAEPSAS